MGESQADTTSRASKVLIVDDERRRRQELALLLTSAGFQVQQAENAEEAEERLADRSAGIVVVDADMPGVNGFDLCARIRKEHGAGVYLLLRTTKKQLAERELTVDEGADDFLIEPLSDREVLARIETGRKMKQLQEKLEETHRSLALLEVTDPLTGAFNKRRTDAELTREFERSRRYTRPVSLVLLDIDGFRGLNDSLGRTAGDRVLAELARILKLSTRASDSVGRYGGEEFAVVAPEADRDAALEAAEKIRKVVEKTGIAVGDRTVHVTVSGGVATFEDNNYETPRDLAAAAEAALAKAKAAGRNRCRAG
jgi:diguanylate cyclase (GGDEF)-like protein